MSQTHALFQKWESLVLTWTCERDFELRYLFRSKVCHYAISYMGLKVKNIRWASSKEHPTSPAKIYMGWTLNEVGFRVPIHTHGVLQVCGGMWVEWIGWKTCVCVAGSSSSSPCKTSHVRYAASIRQWETVTSGSINAQPHHYYCGLDWLFLQTSHRVKLNSTVVLEKPRKWHWYLSFLSIVLCRLQVFTQWPNRGGCVFLSMLLVNNGWLWQNEMGWSFWTSCRTVWTACLKPMAQRVLVVKVDWDLGLE